MRPPRLIVGAAAVAGLSLALAGLQRAGSEPGFSKADDIELVPEVWNSALVDKRGSATKNTWRQQLDLAVPFWYSERGPLQVSVGAKDASSRSTLLKLQAVHTVFEYPEGSRNYRRPPTVDSGLVQQINQVRVVVPSWRLPQLPPGASNRAK